MTRIIGGSARGRRLSVPSVGTRPTSDRVREALFSTVESWLAAEGRSWQAVHALDVFAGSGALGLEAASRGAQRVVFVEKSRASAEVIRSNIDIVLEPEGAEATILVRDAWRLAATTDAVGAADLCFVDPPYERPSVAVRSLLADLHAARWIARDAIVVVERARKDDHSPLPEGWSASPRRTYGDTALWYGRAS